MRAPLEKRVNKKIMVYLKNWALWWVKTTAKTWDYQALLSQFIKSCWQPTLAAFASELLTHSQHETTLLHTDFSDQRLGLVAA